MSHHKGNAMFEDSNNLHVMNEKVQSLANGVYKEFESVIVKYGRDAVKGLMPVVVNILECLDQNIKDKQNNEVDLELTKVEVEHLRNQCDKEKSLRKSADTKYLEMEDLVEESKKQLKQLRNNNDSNVRRLEMKIRNLQDHSLRMDEKEARLKDDYSKMHHKYSSLLKTHTDFLQKASEPQPTNSTKSRTDAEEQKKCADCSNHLPGVRMPVKCRTPEFVSVPHGRASSVPPDAESSAVSGPDFYAEKLLSESALRSGDHESEGASRREAVTVEGASQCEAVTVEDASQSEVVTVEHESRRDGTLTGDGRSIEIRRDDVTSSLPLLSKLEPAETSPKEIVKGVVESSDNETLSQGNSSQDNGAVDAMYGECMIASNALVFKSSPTQNGSGSRLFEIEDDCEAIGGSDPTADDDDRNVSLFEEFSVLEENGGADFLSVGAEVDKLIQENNELLATKNALNVLKDDLIADVEELSGELELLRGELIACQRERCRGDARISELEEELKRSRDEAARLQSTLEARQQEADKTTFSRVELVRILMERNQYKEKWMELQEAVRWAETVRASRAHPELASAPETKKSRTSAVWGFFNSFLGRDKDES